MCEHVKEGEHEENHDKLLHCLLPATLVFKELELFLLHGSGVLMLIAPFLIGKTGFRHRI